MTKWNSFATETPLLFLREVSIHQHTHLLRCHMHIKVHVLQSCCFNWYVKSTWTLNFSLNVEVLLR